MAQAPRRSAVATDSAAWVVEMFYARPAFPTLSSHITAEHRERYADAATMGSRLPPSVRVSSRALLRDDSRALFATSLRDAGYAQDWYTFLSREGGIWKIAAVRTLKVPRVHRVILDSMASRRAQGKLPDSLVAIMETMRLAVQSDSAIAAHLLANRAAMHALAERFATMPRLQAVSVYAEVWPAGALGDRERSALVGDLRALRLGALLRLPRYPGCIFLKIGGSGDDQVGFMHAPPGCRAPAPSPVEFIYIEEVAPGWYVYKTT